MTKTTGQLVREYIEIWKKRDYSDDIPDEVPDRLMQLHLAPSYKAIALALLRNDVRLHSLGFEAAESEWYGVLKREELIRKANGVGFTIDLFR